MLKEFKKFITTGNVIDLSVAVLLAGAMGLVVKGFVEDIMMPIIGHFSGGLDFADMKKVLSAAVYDVDGNVVIAENAIRYGNWINALINLVIVGFVLFLIVKIYSRMRKKVEAEPVKPSKDQELLTEIRDLLKTNK